MGQIVLMNTPILVIGEHNDTPINQVVDDFGTHDVFTITALSWTNLVNTAWSILIYDKNGKVFPYLMEGHEEGSYNIPTPQRFDSYPLGFNTVIGG